MSVSLVVPEPGTTGTGIDRYCSELKRGLGRRGIPTSYTTFRYVPGASRRPVLRAVPIGVDDASGRITHFTRIGGASLLLFRRVANPVVTIHDLGALLCDEDQVMSATLDRLLLRLSLQGVRRARRIITVSEFTRACVISTLGIDPSRVDAIHHGVDLHRFQRIEGARRIVQDRLGITIPGNAAFVLSVGSDQPRKGLHDLARGVAELVRRGDAVHWIKAGAPVFAPGRSALQQTVDELGISGNVTFVDAVSDADLPVFYSAADVFVQPSLWEGFGLPVLEAMSCGAPVVSTRAASLPEVVRDAGILVEPRNPPALANAIALILSHPDLARDYAQRGQRNAARFTWDRTVEETVTSYRRTADGTSMRFADASAGGSR